MTTPLMVGLVTAASVCAAQSGAAAAAGPAAGQDRAGLRLEWRLAGDLRDTAGAGLDGEAVGQFRFEPGRDGPCLTLDGAGGYARAAASLSDLGPAFAIECWVRPAATQRPYADILGNHAGDFTGFVLQQDGSQANRYYFSYGTGKDWVYSRTFALVPDAWQHVGIVKTPDELRVYINGLGVDRRPAPTPLAAGSTPFMVGVGIANEARWFAGQVADVRVWATAHHPAVTVPLAQQLETFVATAEPVCELASRWGLFQAGSRPEVAFRFDPEAVPAVVAGIDVSLGVTDDRGRPLGGAPAAVSLQRATGFAATVPLPDTPGLRRLSYRPTVTVDGQPRALRAGGLSYLVLRPTPATPAPPSAPPATAPARPTAAPSVCRSLDGDGWQLATDSRQEGVQAGWFNAPLADARPTRVPWIIQDAFPGYHGVAWYWRAFDVPPNPHPGGRCLLRFEAVDYKADVWVNGRSVGGHEGGETPFELDITEAVKPGGANLVAVRVLNPSHEPIDGITLNQAPRRAKVIPYSAGASYNHGGIVGSVEVALVPAAYLTDLYVRPEADTGTVEVEATVRHAGAAPVAATLRYAVAPAAGGATLDVQVAAETLAPGETVLHARLQVGTPHLWDVADPYLYRVSAEVAVGNSSDERSDRCGFRQFRFEKGYFRLNGRRLFLRSTHTVNATPVGQQVPGDPALFQRDLVFLKTMGFNGIRFIWGGATRRQLDLCDEIGLLVYDEHAASNPMQDTPQMPERFDRSVAETIRRDRNHPSVVIWGLLNETQDGPVFRHAAGALPLVRSQDETRLVALNSGRWDGQLAIGSFSNPGDLGWDACLGAEAPAAPTSTWGPSGGYWRDVGDAHVYPRVPHSADTVRFLRELGAKTGPVFLSEYGIGSAVDLWRVTRHFECLGKPDAEDAVYYRERLERFLADWRQWRLADSFADPQAFFAASLRKMAGQRTLGLDAIRANPHIVGHSLTGMMDHVNCGEGLFTLFREPKPGTVDALFEGLAPLRLCLFAEPANAWRGANLHLEAVLATEDALPPGEYPVRLQVVGPGLERVFERSVTVTIPPSTAEAEAPLAIPFLAADAPIDGPAGEYRFLATMERGGAPTGGQAAFHLYDPAALPPLPPTVVLCGDDPDLTRWLTERGTRVVPFSTAPAAAEARGVVLVVGKPQSGASEEAGWEELRRRALAGATVVFLRPEVLARGNDPVGWLPLEPKGALRGIHGWLYLKDEWAKTHPIFAGLPAGGLLDYAVYRDVIPDLVFSGQSPPDEAVSGAIKASQDYDSGLMVSVYRAGAGRFLLNTLRIRERLADDPVAECLLRNLLRWAAGPG